MPRETLVTDAWNGLLRGPLGGLLRGRCYAFDALDQDVSRGLALYRLTLALRAAINPRNGAAPMAAEQAMREHPWSGSP
ncbi:MAG TPA: hypothetical protein PKA16_12470 [Ottowia sp.]|uniref:hypothetical protein n=1 Tax=Ottowia sp. TaxID=1898956 RepID=UPI002C23244B|nr:hypothetical protein [Ottowia sp.]HMN22193.1 hypothetical protein [Ottowia sp.]